MKCSDSEAIIFLRKAVLDDKDLLFEWANDPVTRQNSFSSEYIEYEEHCRWFERMMENENWVQYIVMLKKDEVEQPVGQVRIDIKKETAEISYSIDTKYRGCGYGKEALALIKEEVIVNYPGITSLIGQVKPDNIASARAFEREGFTEVFRQFATRIKR